MQKLKIFADGAYASYYNFALVHVVHHARFYTNLGVKAKFNEKGTIEGVQKEYTIQAYKTFYFRPRYLMGQIYRSLLRNDFSLLFNGWKFLFSL